jgi:hypothetical protein
MTENHGMVGLSAFLERAVPHERVPASLDPGLRLGALVSCGLLGGYLLMVLLAAPSIGAAKERPPFFFIGWRVVATFATLGHHAPVAIVLSLIGLASAGYWAIATEGFRTGTLRELVGLGILMTLGCLAAIPLVVVLAVVALNLAIWIGILIFGLIAGAMFFAFLWSLFTEAWS